MADQDSLRELLSDLVEKHGVRPQAPLVEAYVKWVDEYMDKVLVLAFNELDAVVKERVEQVRKKAAQSIQF